MALSPPGGATVADGAASAVDAQQPPDAGEIAAFASALADAEALLAGADGSGLTQPVDDADQADAAGSGGQ